MGSASFIGLWGRQEACPKGLTLVVLIVFPGAAIHPELSGSVLHSSPSRQGSISHHHFPITMDAAAREQGHRHVNLRSMASATHTHTHTPTPTHTTDQSPLTSHF